VVCACTYHGPRAPGPDKESLHSSHIPRSAQRLQGAHGPCRSPRALTKRSSRGGQDGVREGGRAGGGRGGQLGRVLVGPPPGGGTHALGTGSGAGPGNYMMVDGKVDGNTPPS
jgi:hypothetical protein